MGKKGDVVSIHEKMKLTPTVLSCLYLHACSIFLFDRFGQVIDEQCVQPWILCTIQPYVQALKQQTNKQTKEKKNSVANFAEHKRIVRA